LSLASRRSLAKIGDARLPTKGGADASTPDFEADAVIEIDLRVRSNDGRARLWWPPGRRLPAGERRRRRLARERRQ